MTELLNRYLALEAKLSRWRAEHPHFTTEEAEMLDELDHLWWQFNRHELVWLDQFLNNERRTAA